MKIRITAVFVLLCTMFLMTASTTQAQYKSAPGYKVVFAPNPDMVDIHVNRLLTPTETTSMEMTYDSMYMSSYKQQPSSLMRQLTRIKGVTDVYIKPYELTIGKGEAFTWKEIMPGVMSILKAKLAPKGTLTKLAPDRQEPPYREDQSSRRIPRMPGRSPRVPRTPPVLPN